MGGRVAKKDDRRFDNSSSLTVFWSNQRCDELISLKQEGKRLTHLFGGPHLSQPSFRRACVREGDLLYPVRVKDGILYVIGQMRVKRILTLAPSSPPSRPTS
jgi:hypothetical protein